MKKEIHSNFSFSKINFIIMLVGIFFIITGFILMIGGGSDNPEIFNPEIFSFRRISLAPLLVLTGFIIEIVAILYNGKKIDG